MIIGQLVWIEMALLFKMFAVHFLGREIQCEKCFSMQCFRYLVESSNFAAQKTYSAEAKSGGGK